MRLSEFAGGLEDAGHGETQSRAEGHESRKLSGHFRLHLRDDSIEVSQRFVDRERVHLPPYALAGLESGLQVMAGDLDGERVGDHLAGAVLVLHPGGMRERDPDFSPVDEELEVYGIGMARGYGHDHGLVDAVNLFLRPAVGGSEVLKHG